VARWAAGQPVPRQPEVRRPPAPAPTEQELAAWTAAARGWVPLVSDAHLLHGLIEAGMPAPTAVQRELLPLLKEAKATVLAEGPSASGKTVAALVALANQDGGRALYLAPTPDLVDQAFDEFSRIAAHAGVSAGKAGGAPAQVLFATPVGFGRAEFQAAGLRLVVLDEAEVLLDPKRHHLRYVQRLFGSAPSEFRCIALSNAAGAEAATATLAEWRPSLKHVIIRRGKAHVKFFSLRVRTPGEFEAALAELCASAEQVLFFSQDGPKLAVPGVTSHCSSGSRVSPGGPTPSPTPLQEFAAGKVKALFASDALCRGVKCRGLGLVVQLDLPELWEGTRRVGFDLDVFCQRAWRAARPGKAGACVSLVGSDAEEASLKEVAGALKLEVTELALGSLATGLAD
jgi:superfamily II DNA/RNA helicase